MDARREHDTSPYVYGVPRLTPARGTPADMLRVLLAQPPTGGGGDARPHVDDMRPLVDAARFADDYAPVLLAPFGDAHAHLVARPALVCRLLARLGVAHGFVGADARPAADTLLGLLADVCGFHAELARRAWVRGHGTTVLALVLRVLLAAEAEATVRARWREYRAAGAADAAVEREVFARACHSLVLVSDTHLELAAWIQSTLMYVDAALRQPGVLTLVAPDLAVRSRQLHTRNATTGHWQTRFYANFAARAFTDVSALELFWPDATRGWDAGRLPDLTRLLQMGSLWHEVRSDDSLLGAMVHLFASKTTNHACLKRNFVAIVARHCRRYPVLIALLRDVVATSLLGLFDYRLDGARPAFRDRVAIVDAWSAQTPTYDAWVDWVSANENLLLFVLREYYCHMLARLAGLRDILARYASADMFARCVWRMCDTMRRHQGARGGLALDARHAYMARTADMALPDRAALLLAMLGGREAPVAAPTDPATYLAWRAGAWIHVDADLAAQRFVAAASGAVDVGAARGALAAAMCARSAVRPARMQNCRRAYAEYRAACQRVWGSRRLVGIEAEAKLAQQSLLRISYKLRKGSFADVALAHASRLLRQREVDATVKRDQTAMYFVVHDASLLPPGAAHDSAALARCIDLCAQHSATVGGQPMDADLAARAPCAGRMVTRWLPRLGVSRAATDEVRRLLYEYEVGNIGDNRVAKRMAALHGASRRDFMLVAAFLERHTWHAARGTLQLPAAVVQQQVEALRWRSATPWWAPLPPGSRGEVYYCAHCRCWANDCVDARGPHRVWTLDAVRGALSMRLPARGMYAHGPLVLQWDDTSGAVNCVRRKPHTVVTLDHRSGEVVARQSTARRGHATEYTSVLDQFVNADHGAYSWERDVWPALYRYFGYDAQLDGVRTEAARLRTTERARFVAETAGLPAAADAAAIWARHAAAIDEHERTQTATLERLIADRRAGCYTTYTAAVRTARRQYEASRCSFEPALRLVLLGRVVQLDGRMWALCSMCATVALWTPENMGAHGFTCGCHALALQRRAPATKAGRPRPTTFRATPALALRRSRPFAVVGFDDTAMPLLRIAPGGPVVPAAEPSLAVALTAADAPPAGTAELERHLGRRADVLEVRRAVARAWTELCDARRAAGMPGGMVTLRVADAPRGPLLRRCTVCDRPENNGRQRLVALPVVDDGDGRTEGREEGSAAYRRVRCDDARLCVVLLCMADFYAAQTYVSSGEVYSRGALLTLICERRLQQRLAT